MVDAVFSFEGDGAHAFRLLRAAKNRFGATDEVGVFEMTGGGLAEVPNPSALFLAERDGAAHPGAAVFAGVEGARPLLVEIQALVAPTTFGTPRRAVVGWEPSRLAMVLAVLEAHGGMKLGQYDVYLNVAGGLRIMEPAADLAAAAALISSLTGASLPRDAVYFGEIGLSGSVRGGCACGIAAQGGRQAWLRPRLRAAVAARRRRAREYRRAADRQCRRAGRADRRERRRNESGTRQISGPQWGDELRRLGYKALASAATGRTGYGRRATRFVSQMPSYLDLAVLGIVLVSALLSMMRGFTREVLAIASWAAAAAAAYYFYPLRHALPHALYP